MAAALKQNFAWAKWQVHRHETHYREGKQIKYPVCYLITDKGDEIASGDLNSGYDIEAINMYKSGQPDFSKHLRARA